MWKCRKLRYNGKQFSDYTIERFLGEGKYGIAFLGKSSTDQTVIIKKFKKRFFKKSIENHYIEAVILSKLDDSRIPKLLGIINEKEFYGFILEYINGSTIKEMLFKYKYRFTTEEIFTIVIKLISIIKYIHENGIVHKDISTSNVIFNENKVYLIDFGLARWQDNNLYPFNLDFSFLGDFLLYLLYSSFETKDKHINLPWYKELNLNSGQKLFLKRLLGLEVPYSSIQEIETDFIAFFSNTACNSSIVGLLDN